MYNYLIAYDDGNILIRHSEDGWIGRYDTHHKKWVFDIDMAAIFTDKMPTRPISKKEADCIIKESNDNRWSKMDDYNYHISRELDNLLIREGEDLTIQKNNSNFKYFC